MMLQPKKYSKYNDLQKTDNLFVLEKYLKFVEWKKGGEAILDVGSGDGKFAVEYLIPRLPKNVGKYLGCDIAENMVKFSKENYKSSNVDFVVFDITSAEMPITLKSGFDHVFSFYTLHWVEKQRQAFKNMYKLLKPGGDLLLTFLASNPIYDVYLNMAKSKKWRGYTKREYIAPYHGCEEPEKLLENLVQETGFQSHICKVENRTYVFPNLSIWEKSVKAVNPIIARLPKEEIPNYMKNFLEEAKKLKCVTVESINNNEETISIRYKLFVVYATKPLERDIKGPPLHCR